MALVLVSDGLEEDFAGLSVFFGAAMTGFDSKLRMTVLALLLHSTIFSTRKDNEKRQREKRRKAKETNTTVFKMDSYSTSREGAVLSLPETAQSA